MRKLLLSSFLFLCTFFVVDFAKAQIFLQESFEGTFPPTGWTLINAGTSPNNWAQYTNAQLAGAGIHGAQDGSNIAGLLYNSTNAANGWLITPVQNLTAGIAYTISFYYSVADATYPEKMKVTVGNSATVAAQTNVLWDNNGGTELTNEAWAQGVISFTPTSTGNYYFGFNCYSNADEYLMMLDNVKVERINACSGTPVAGNAASSTNIRCSAGTVDLSLTGSSSATGLTYQWQSSPAGAGSFTNIGPSSSTSTYTASVSASTDFRAVVTCTASGQSSTSTPVTVTISSVPANDDFCSAQAMALDAPYVCGNTTCATSTGDPTFSQSLPNNTVWYTYTPTTSGPVQIRMKRPAGMSNGFLYAWTGIYTATGACPSLTFTEEAGNTLAYDLTSRDSVSNLTSSLNAGTTYYIMVDGFSGSFGAYCMRILTPPSPPACVTNVTPANGATNRPIIDTLRWRKAAGNEISYDLYFGTAATPPFLGTLTDTTVTITGMAYNTTYNWFVVPKNGGVPATGCNTNMTSFTTAAPPPPPVNDECVDAIAISPYSGPVNGTTISSTQSQAADLCNGTTSGTAHDVWYKFTALQNGGATIALTNADAALDAVILAYRGNCGTLTNIGCADDGFTGGEDETLVLTGLIAGQTYYLRVYGWATTSGQGAFTLNVSGTALPVRITQFSGTRQGNVNKLTWTTASEVNNAGFDLQRSADGKNFSTLQFVQTNAPEGNSSSSITYNYVDDRPFAGGAYYRLKQIDRDGKFSYSNIVLIKGDRTDKLDIVNVYPNPAVDKINVVFVSPVNEKVNFVVTDLTGKIIISQAMQLATGDNNISVDVSALSAGSYIIKTICNSGCENAIRKFVKH